jgi:quercetin dioxygenase-like cupin family protein
MRVRLALCVAVVCAFVVPVLRAQDAVKVDPKHYSVISENEHVRILKAHYGPGEKSVMHSHPAGVAVYLTDGKVKFTFGDGKTQDATATAGGALYTEPVTHLPENVGTAPFDVIVIEFKGHGSKMKSDMKSDMK